MSDLYSVRIYGKGERVFELVTSLKNLVYVVDLLQKSEDVFILIFFIFLSHIIQE